MTTPPPDDGLHQEQDPAAERPTGRFDRERTGAEIDAEFTAIISGMADQMSWTVTDDQLDRAATTDAATIVEADGSDEVGAGQDLSSVARDRERRREIRRAERAQEIELFEMSKAAADAELAADDQHFVPPDPPPVPRPKRRTVVALLLMAVGILMLVRPSLLQVAPDVVLVLAIIGLMGGFSMLVWGLRRTHGDPDDADGWDDGARL